MLQYVYIVYKAKFYQSALMQINYYIQSGVFSTILAKDLLVSNEMFNFAPPKMVFFSGRESSV